MNFFKTLIKDGRRSFKSKVEGAELILKIFGDKIDDTDFRLWLADALNVDLNDLISFIKYAEDDPSTFTPRGRTFLSVDVRQSAYNFWKVNSEISVHRSNGRHLVNISKENLLNQVADLVDDGLKTVETKRGPQIQAHKRITTKPYRSLHKDFQQLYNSTISYGTFINVKPFYVSRPTEKETEMCLCSKCLNPHCLYKALTSALKTELPRSLSQYLCKNMKCEKESKTRYFHRDCILGKCDNSCQIVNIAADLKNHLSHFELNVKKVNYYVFETVTTKYFNKSGKQVSYTRTARVDKNESLLSIIDRLQQLAKNYLLHRFSVINDQIYWKEFLETTSHHTLWLDYSQNIAFTEKRQVQSAHFSGKQHTLHNTVVQSPDGENLYVYHLSDDTNHGSVLTFYIIKDIIHSHPEVIENGFLVLRSDNCQEQYKSKFTFFQMKKLASEFGITIVWFYGEPGHGRGLVDAMSSFGCKQQLRHEIVTNDNWFDNAESMVDFLSKSISQMIVIKSTISSMLLKLLPLGEKKEKNLF